MTVTEGFKDMIAIINYNAGNITSVARALHSIGQEYIITDDTKMLNSASHIIFPGVGAAGEAMAYLKQKGLDAWLKICFQSGKPLMGICLGTQIILDHSEENGTECIGLVAGSTKRFPEQLTSSGQVLKIPHMGWNSLQVKTPSPLFPPADAPRYVYFVHSYHAVPNDAAIITAVTDYGGPVTAAVGRGAVQAVQFHPEKSSTTGLAMLRAFKEMNV